MLALNMPVYRRMRRSGQLSREQCFVLVAQERARRALSRELDHRHRADMRALRESHDARMAEFTRRWVVRYTSGLCA